MLTWVMSWPLLVNPARSLVSLDIMRLLPGPRAAFNVLRENIKDLLLKQLVWTALAVPFLLWMHP